MSVGSWSETITLVFFHVALLQLNADCLDDLPLDYDLDLGRVSGVGGVGVLALEAVVSGASSDGTLSEGGSSVVLDPGVRRVGLPQDYQDPDTLRDSPVTTTTDTHTGDSHTPSDKCSYTDTQWCLCPITRFSHGYCSHTDYVMHLYPDHIKLPLYFIMRKFKWLQKRKQKYNFSLILLNERVPYQPCYKLL